MRRPLPAYPQNRRHRRLSIATEAADESYASSKRLARWRFRYDWANVNNVKPALTLNRKPQSKIVLALSNGYEGQFWYRSNERFEIFDNLARQRSYGYLSFLQQDFPMKKLNEGGKQMRSTRIRITVVLGATITLATAGMIAGRTINWRNVLNDVRIYILSPHYEINLPKTNANDDQKPKIPDDKDKPTLTNTNTNSTRPKPRRNSFKANTLTTNQSCNCKSTTNHTEQIPIPTTDEQHTYQDIQTLQREIKRKANSNQD